jgi:hypothetical protein
LPSYCHNPKDMAFAIIRLRIAGHDRHACARTAWLFKNRVWLRPSNRAGVALARVFGSIARIGQWREYGT